MESPTNGRYRNMEGYDTPANSAARVEHPPGLTLEQYAKAKGLTVDFLSALGLSTIFLNGLPALRIPYHSLDGSEAAISFRVAMQSYNHFRWKSGSNPCLYGLSKLPEAEAAGFINLVESPSDCQTLWYHEMPALGLPCGGTWRAEWAKHLERIPIIYVPARAGTGINRGWFAVSAIRDRLHLIEIPDGKDVSALYLSNLKPSRFSTRLGCGH